MALALIARLFFSSFAPFQSDIDSFIAWGEQMYRVGPANFYGSGIWTDYAPGYMYFLWFVAAIKNSFFGGINKTQYEFMFKLIPMLFDIGIGVYLYKLIEYVQESLDHSKKLKSTFLPLVAAGLYLFSPFSFFNSAIWGQADSVFCFFLIVSFYYLVRDRFILACSLFVIATIIKPQAGIVLPLYLVYLLKNWDFGLAVKAFLSSIVTFYLLIGPFWGANGLQRLISQLQTSINTYPYGSLNTFNVWGVNGFWKSDTETVYQQFTSQQIGSGMFIALLIIGTFCVLYYLKKNSEKYNQVFYYAYFAAYLIFSAIMTLTRMHERYLYPLFPFLVIITVLIIYKSNAVNSASSIIYYLIAVFVHSVNIYYVYVLYNYFSTGVPAENSFYHAIENSLSIWSYLMVGLYIIFTLSFVYFNRIFQKK